MRIVEARFRLGRYLLGGAGVNPGNQILRSEALLVIFYSSFCEEYVLTALLVRPVALLDGSL
jgi:hypothetical protein